MKTECRKWQEVDPLDFSAELLRIQTQPPRPFASAILYSLFILFGLLLIWAIFGKLDIVASAEGKLLPQSYLKIVQPSEQGVIRDILVSEGEHVKAGQLLMRMDATISEADGKTLGIDAQSKRLALRRIDAELTGNPFTSQSGDPADLFTHIFAQYQANCNAYESALSHERSLYDKAQSDLSAATETRTKLLRTLPHYSEQAQAYTHLAQDGFVSRLVATDKIRERIEKEQDFKAQEYIIQSAESSLIQSTRKLAQITADYRRQLQIERNDTEGKLDKSQGELVKQQYRHKLLELKASQDGIIKDLATHTAGAVISPGAILMNLVPEDEILRAEVWVSNQDVGFIHTGEPVKIKLASYQFQKYGMVEGTVIHLSADASDAPSNQQPTKSGSNMPFAYRALIDLKAQYLIADGVRYSLTPGMQVTAEIHLGARTILEYLLSPVTGAFQEAARER